MDITAGDFLGLCDHKSLYKYLYNFGQLWSYGHLELRMEDKDY